MSAGEGMPQEETKRNVLEVVEDDTEDENNATLAMNDALAGD